MSFTNLLRKLKKKLHPILRRTFKGCSYTFAIVLALLAVLFTLARLWLPTLEEKKTEIEDYLSRQSSHLVRVETLHTYWDGLKPGLRVTGLRVYSKNYMRPSVNLAEVRMTLALTPLLWGSVEIDDLVLVKPALAFERLPDGRFRVTGFDPIRVKETSETAGFANWVFRQRNVIIEDGEFQWYDHLSDEAAVYLSHANLRLQNSGDRHQLGISANFPSEICAECSLRVDIVGNPFESRNWSGEIFLNAVDLDISNLPKIAKENLKPGLSGKFSVRLWTDWEDGRPEAISGHVKTADLNIPLKTAPLTIKHAETDISWKGNLDEWSLRLDNLVLGLRGPDWSAGKIKVQHHPKETWLTVQYVNLNDITSFVETIINEGKVNTLLRSLAIQGGLNDVYVRLEGDMLSPKDFLFEANVADLSSRPYKKLPGFLGLNGRISASKDQGSFKLNTSDTTLLLPTVFREPVAVGYARGNFRWSKKGDEWVLVGENLFATSRDGGGEGSLLVRIPVNRALSPYLKLDIDFSGGNGANVHRYYPINVLKQSTITWLEQAIVSGRVTGGHLDYDGKISEFPFRDGNGSFHIRARVSDAVFNYLPGWLPIEYGEAEISSDGKQLLITGDAGMVRGLRVSKVVAHAKDIRKGGETVFNITGVILGPVSEALKVLRHNAIDKQYDDWVDFFPAGLKAEGNAVLSLEMDIYTNTPKKFRLNGEYLFRQSRLTLPAIGVDIENISGPVQFTKEGISGGRLTGRYLGSDASMELSREDNKRNPTVYANAKGTWTTAGLARAYAQGLGNLLEGRAAWKGSARFRNGIIDIEAESDLQHIQSKLPRPLHNFDGAGVKLVLKTMRSSPDDHLIRVGVGDQVDGRLLFKRTEEGWSFRKGHIALGGGTVSLPRKGGMHLSARANAVDIDSWLDMIKSNFIDAQQLPEFIQRLSGDFLSASAFNRDLGGLVIDMKRKGQAWSGSVQGNSIDGRATYTRTDGLIQIDLNLRQLNIPKKKTNIDDGDMDPRELPALAVISQSFFIEGKPFGNLDFQASSIPDGWNIDRLTMSREEMNLQVQGAWLRDERGDHSQFEFTFASKDLGKTLETYGNSGHMDNGDVEIKAKMSWNDVPTSPSVASINGKIDIKSKNGRFLQVKQGAGRLFGLLDLSSIGRYLSLDFSAIFGKGFYYNKIHGEVNVANGNATTQGLIIRGPSAQLKVAGRVGLVAEDFDLELWMTPRFRESLTVTSWGLFGPQAAAVALAIQKLFKKQISKKTTVGYVIKGPWADPQFTRVAKEEAEEPTGHDSQSLQPVFD